MVRLGLSWIVCLCAALFSVSGFTQELAPVFPANGGEASIDDLVTRGFEWTAPEGATQFSVVLNTPNPLSPQIGPVTVTDTKYVLPQITRIQLQTGQYSWSVSITGGAGTGTVSGNWAFLIPAVGQGFEPSPTPVGFQTPTPAGNIDGNAVIDSKDVIALAHKWQVQSQRNLGQFDLNSDGVVNQIDLLLMINRQGLALPTATPTPPAGIVENITFIPGREVSISQTRNFEIRWDPPSHPDASQVIYDVFVENITFQDVEKRGLTTNSFKPFAEFPFGFTQTGPQTVFIRTKTLDGQIGLIATDTFEVVLSAPPIATPTPTPFPVVDENIAPPSWASADVPNMEPDGPFCAVIDRTTVDFSTEPLNLAFDWQTNPCAVAELQDPDNGLLLTFNPVVGAVSYTLKMTKIIDGLEPFEFLSKPTIENNSLRISTDLESATYLLQLQASLANGSLSNYGDPLTIDFVSVF
ncbi:MAG: hypothetical protein P9L94_08105 [Candidatus Hinthialibacter antarcticus]|nr:hypothetical protein [Candidatus Hinthialibacter antarcticus]